MNTFICVYTSGFGWARGGACVILMVADGKIETINRAYGFIEDNSAYYLLSSKPVEQGSAAAIFTQWLIEQVNISIETLIDKR